MIKKNIPSAQTTVYTVVWAFFVFPDASRWRRLQASCMKV